MPQLLTNNVITGDPLLSWTVREYETHDRGQVWYIFMISVGLLLVIYGMLSGNFMFSLIIILSGIILYLQSQQKPQDVTIDITELGVIVGTKMYVYSEFHSFYIIYQPPEVKTLFLQPHSPWRPLIRIPLHDMNPVDIRTILLEFLPEDIKKEAEPFSDTIARRWKIH